MTREVPTPETSVGSNYHCPIHYFVSIYSTVSTGFTKRTISANIQLEKGLIIMIKRLKINYKRLLEIINIFQSRICADKKKNQV